VRTSESGLEDCEDGPYGALGFGIVGQNRTFSDAAYELVAMDPADISAVMLIFLPRGPQLCGQLRSDVGSLFFGQSITQFLQYDDRYGISPTLVATQAFCH
jgi:hypothetical protein